VDGEMIDLIERLLYEEESTTLDFKEEQYAFIGKNEHQKSELLKDILAFANAWRREDSYILIGVKEVKGEKSIIVGIDDEDKIDDASLQEFVNKKINKPINFEYKNVSIDDKMIGIIKIPLENNKRPFFLKSDYGKLKKNEVKIRRGSSTDIADPDEIFKMSSDNIVSNKDPILKIEFADNKNKTILGKNIKVESEYWNIVDKDDIPDYTESNYYNEQLHFRIGSKNSAYYREVVEYYFSKKLYQSISFSLYNDSNILATDIKIEVKLEGNIVNILKKLPKYPENSYDYLKNNINRLNDIEIKPDILVEKRNDIWYLELLFKKIQPKQRLYCKDLIYFAVAGEALLKYIIYADNLPEPIDSNLSIKHSVKIKEMSYKDVLKYDEEIEKKEVGKMIKEQK